MEATAPESRRQCGEIFANRLQSQGQAWHCCLRIFLRRQIYFCHKLNLGTPASFLSHFMVFLILEALLFVSLQPSCVFIGKEIYMVHYHRIPLTPSEHRCGDREPSSHPDGAWTYSNFHTFIVSKGPSSQFLLIHMQSVTKSKCF